MSETAEKANSLDFAVEFDTLVGLVPSWPTEFLHALSRAFASGPDGTGLPWLVILGLMLAAGLAAEGLGCSKLRARSAALTIQKTEGLFAPCAYAILRVLFDLAGLVLFALCALAVLYFMVDTQSSLYRTLGELLRAIVLVRGFLVVGRAIFAPHAEGIRMLPLSNDDARVLLRWIVWFSAVYSLSLFLVEAAIHSGLSPILGRASIVVNGLVLIIFLCVFMWVARDRIARQFTDGSPSSGGLIQLRQTFSQSWPAFLTAWLVILWLNWGHAMFVQNLGRVGSLQLAWWTTLLFPLADRLIHALLKALVGADFVQSSPFAARSERFVRVVQTGFRVILFAVAVFAMGVAWQIAGVSMAQSEMGQRVISGVIDIGITLLLAYVLWEVVIAILDQSIPKPADDDAPPVADGEGGGGGATRRETLAPLLRGTFIVFLVGVVIISVLSALGVQITPLLAGAGVFGLAVGFGAQKLVQDIISGVFFLLDDAFRRGEYIDVGEVKGVVEKISIRSMQLRHHMGSLHTIPFGEIRYLTNFSRDWVMMKLKLRLAYGTDPERVRKLVKKLGQQLLDDPEVGELFMEPLKSQGVFSMEDDSAVIFRIKFMTKPGDQFVVRKTVYAAINELFEREGIEFAHRVVTVRVAEDPGGQVHTDAEKQKIAGAVLPVIDAALDEPVGDTEDER